MPRYFFDIYDETDIRDEIGRDIDDPRDVRREAAAVISRLMASEIEDGDGLTLILTVRDQIGTVMLTIRMVSQIDDSQELSGFQS